MNKAAGRGVCVLAVFLFDLCVLCSTGSPAVYYVSPKGSNSNPGTISEPWATPGYGSRQLKAGDTLLIKKGRYILSQYDADIITPPSGRSNAWITIKGVNADKRPVLAGRNNLAQAVQLSDVSYIKIENLEITSAKNAVFRDGISAVSGPVSHIIFNNLFIHHINEFGMNLKDVNHLLILDSKMTYCGFGALGGPEAVHGGWRNVLIKSCDLSYSGHFYRGGKNPYNRPDGFGIEPSAGPVTIVEILAEHNKGDGIDSKAGNTFIYESIVANNRCDGIKLWRGRSKIENSLIYGRGDGDTQVTPWAAIVIGSDQKWKFEIINVTVDDFFGKNYLMYVQYDTPDIPLDLIIKNSIFTGRGKNCPIYLAKAVNFKYHNCLFYFPKNDNVLIHDGVREYTPAQVTQLGPGNIYGKPFFASPAFGKTGDYRVRKKSPAIDKGTAGKKGLPIIDLGGNERTFDGNGDKKSIVDIGAYEYNSKPLEPGLACLFYPSGEISITRPDFIWTAVDKADNYYLTVKQGSTFIVKNQKHSASVVCENGICSVRLPDRLIQGEKYTWRIRAANKNNKGGWSRKKSFKMK